MLTYCLLNKNNGLFAFLVTKFLKRNPTPEASFTSILFF
jgi:hypothetical protein